MASSPSKTLGILPEMPKISLSKRMQERLEVEYFSLCQRNKEARKKINPSHGFDAVYWLSAAAVSDVSAKTYEVETKLAIQQWKEEDGGGDMMAWWCTPKAHHLIEKFKAASYEKKLYTQQAEHIQRGEPMRRAFQAIFTTSQIGLGTQNAGVVKRIKQQPQFRTSLIKAYDAEIRDLKKTKVGKRLHDTATGKSLFNKKVIAAHVVPHSVGPEVLIGLFGINVEGELDTPYNGLILHQTVVKAMDDGAIAIVPDIPDDPSPEEVATWEAADPKEYKWRVIDDEAEILEDELLDDIDMTVRDLGGKRLSFRTNARPRARYLYYLFVVAQLKLAWRRNYRKDPTKEKQLGKGFWATKGCYLKRSFLLAVAEEIGHESHLSVNIPMGPGYDNEPDETGLIGIAKLVQFQQRRYDDQYEDEDEEDEDEDEGPN